MVFIVEITEVIFSVSEVSAAEVVSADVSLTDAVSSSGGAEVNSVSSVCTVYELLSSAAARFILRK